MTLSIEQVESSIAQWSATKKAELLFFILKNLGEPALGIENAVFSLIYTSKIDIYSLSIIYEPIIRANS